MRIQCLLGPAATTVGSSNYEFSRDGHGRFVAIVTNPDHIKCLLSAGTYAEAAEDGEDDEEEDAAALPGEQPPRRGRRKRRAG